MALSSSHNINLADILIDPNYFDARMHYAALEGDVELIRKIVSEEPETARELAQKKIGPIGSTPLRLASTGGHADTVHYLLDQLGASADSVDFKGQTALFVAIKYRHGECARTLLEHGANPNGSLENVCSPLYVATQDGYIEGVLLLLEYGAETADFDRLLGSSSSPPRSLGEFLSLVSEHRHSLRPNDVTIGQSLLYVAIVYRHADCYAALLLVGGAEPDLRYVRPRLPTSVICSLSLVHALATRTVSDFFVRLFVVFGGNLWQRDARGRLAVELSDAIPSSTIALKRYMGRPLALKDLCRISIRRCLARNHLIPSLPLPPTLIDFLHYRDEINVSYGTPC